MKELDARGLDCPKPVVKTKQALQEATKVVVTVDNQIAADNVAKLAKKLNCQVTILEKGNEYKLTIKQQEVVKSEEEESGEGKVYFLTSNTLGEGEEKLGEILMKGFISTLLDIRPVPDKIIFMNSGVKVPTLNQQALEHLQELEDQGVTILSCGTCLDYYDLTDKLEVGSISNMYEILEVLNSEEVVEI